MEKLNKKGQALVEYVLIIALVTVIAVSLIKIFGEYSYSYFEDLVISSSFQTIETENGENEKMAFLCDKFGYTNEYGDSITVSKGQPSFAIGYFVIILYNIRIVIAR